MIGMIEDDVVERLIDEQLDRMIADRPVLAESRGLVRAAMVVGSDVRKLAEINLRLDGWNGKLKLGKGSKNGD